MTTPGSVPTSTSSFRTPLLLCLACLAAYGGGLSSREFFHDDQLYIRDNPLLHRGLKAIPEILSTGYCEPATGIAAPVQEYRPMLVLSYLAQTWTTGFSAAPMRAANIALHALASVLLWLALKRRFEPSAAAAGALVYAVLPVHAEAVLMIGWRSEILTAISVLGAWLCLEDGRRLWGLAFYCAGLLTKEPAILFPGFFAMADWIFHGRKPWQPSRRGLYAALAACALGYLALRTVVLSRFMHGGAPYFQSRLTAAFTAARFFFDHYVWTSITGLGLCSDYSRPLIADAALGSPAAWFWPAVLVSLVALAARHLILRRAAWAFWLLAPGLFLLPTSHLVFPLDTIGADRFLYLPTIGLAAGASALFWRLPRKLALAAFAGLGVWYLGACFRRAAEWRTGIGFYESALRCNPTSAKARQGLGGSLLAAGRVEEGRKRLLEASALDPSLPGPYYNLGRLAWSRGDLEMAESLLRKAAGLEPGDSDAWTLLAETLRGQKKPREAAACLAKAVAANPNHAAAHFNLGRLELELGRAGAARAHLRRFVELAPDDPDAGPVALFLEESGE